MPESKNKSKIIGSASFMFLVFVSLALVWLYFRIEGQTFALGEKIQQLEKELAETERIYMNELGKWENMNSAASIEQALARHNLSMVWPKASASVRLGSPESFLDLREGSESETAGRIARAATE